jgi:glycosyltransferase involved in cell wall biosynthesis
MNKYRFHLLGLAHTKTHTDWVSCAYTMKVLKMCKMLTDAGHTVIHYGAEGSNPICTEHVNVISDAEQAYCYEARKWPCVFYDFDSQDFAYKKFNENAIREINVRKQPRDILLCSMGHAHKPVSDGTKLLTVESGVGYTGTFANHIVYESYAWMHYMYGMKYPNQGSCDGRNYDAVIPNYFDVKDFEFSDKKEDYLLYVGRLIPRKGVTLAYEVAKQIGMKLKIAGAGNLKDIGLSPADPIIEYVGVVGIKDRSDLMKGAKAILVPTHYIGPFEGVSVEAMFCGTPAITPDFGCFTETVEHGKVGYRCRTIEQYVWAAKNVDKLDPQYIRNYAINNYSIERVGKMYEEYFRQVSGLFDKGFYEENPNRTELDWLKRF